ncbi:MAG: integration host factor, actinobacterial type [Coriobacteriales bacterium]
MPLPQLSEEDRKKALEKAAAARKARAQVKDNLKHGQMSAREALESDDPVVTKMKVTDFLKSLPGWGKAKADKTMQELEIAENRRLGGLGANQKAAILEMLEKAE